MTRLTHKIICGNSETELKQFEDNAFDSCVTDPPYGIEFMGREWDKFEKGENIAGGTTGLNTPFGRKRSLPAFYQLNNSDLLVFQQFTYQWATELFRVMKPGAHILVFGGDRTEHRMKCGVEDAGFTIRRTIPWVFSSGFPKSLDISKQIDKMAGVEREVIGIKQGHEEFANRNNLSSVQSLKGTLGNTGGFARPWMDDPEKVERYHQLTSPTTEEAIQWNGWGTNLKPAIELICMARKPISESNIASNVLKWGTGGINIDGCRIVYENTKDPATNPRYRIEAGYKCEHGDKIFEGKFKRGGHDELQTGRYPANLILSCNCEDDELIEGKVKSGGGTQKGINYSIYGQTIGHNIKYFNYGDENSNEKCLVHTNPNCVCRMLDEQSGELHSGGGDKRNKDASLTSMFGIGDVNTKLKWENNKGRASRFFYQAKASQIERWFYCTVCNHAFQMEERDNHIHNAPEEKKYKYLEFHPTQKPLELIKYLVRLITPPNGVVLDPFVGTGTTLVAAEKEGFSSIGIDSKPEYCKIAARRIQSELGQLSFDREISVIEKLGF